MTGVAAVLTAVATELANQAKSQMPELRDGERIVSEYLDNGRFYRETELNGAKITAVYNFREKKLI